MEIKNEFIYEHEWFWNWWACLIDFQLGAVLFSLGFYTYTEHTLRKKLAALFDASIEAKRCPDTVHRWTTFLILRVRLRFENFWWIFSIFLQTQRGPFPGNPGQHVLWPISLLPSGLPWSHVQPTRRHYGEWCSNTKNIRSDIFGFLRSIGIDRTTLDRLNCWVKWSYKKGSCIWYT